MTFEILETVVTGSDEKYSVNAICYCCYGVCCLKIAVSDGFYFFMLLVSTILRTKSMLYTI